jgi:hypothetical protein
MKRPLSLIIIACLGIFGGFNGLLDALGAYRRGNINAAQTATLVGVLMVAVGIGLLRLQRWAWIVCVGYFAYVTYVLGVSVWRGIDHPVSFLATVPPLIVLLSAKVLQAFWGDYLGSGEIPASTASAAPSFPVSTEHEATVPMKQSWLRRDVIGTISDIIGIISAIIAVINYLASAAR